MRASTARHPNWNRTVTRGVWHWEWTGIVREWERGGERGWEGGEVDYGGVGA